MNATDKKTDARKLIVPRFKEAAYERQIYQASVEAGVSFEETLKPEFWSHVAARLRHNDRIEVLAEDGEYFGELIVQDVGRLYAKVGVLRFVELGSPAVDPALTAAMAPQFVVEYKGPTLKHCVIRKADNEIIQEGISKKGDAELWLSEHQKTISR